MTPRTADTGEIRARRVLRWFLLFFVTGDGITGSWRWCPLLPVLGTVFRHGAGQELFW
ncbi:MAG: hypothetical protein FWD79_09975 [Desulfobulbus sp.]|nr:hypothetical protein [Desulfobulbus sp.]